jgi:imidazolonepropionase-like amidohydrolase
MPGEHLAADGRPALHLRGTIVIDDDREVGECWAVGGRLTFERPAARCDLVEGWVLPGLVDVHCHIGLAASGAVDRPTARAQALTDRDAGTLLIRDAGSPADTRWVHAEADLPELIRAGHHLARPRRYLQHYGLELADVDSLPAAVAEQAAFGEGWVKLVADWIDRDEGAAADLRPLWPADLLTRAIARAHAAGARVTAHTFAHEAVDPLLAAGIDCLEHGTGLDARQIDEVARRGIPVTPTLLQVANFDAIAARAGRYPAFAARMLRMHARRYEHVKDLYDAGVRLLAGTDAGGTITHGRLPEEVAELVRAGVPAPAAVASASWRTREYLGRPGIEEGAPADVVVYPADPRLDVGVLAHPDLVILRGVVVSGARVGRHAAPRP